MEDPLRLSPENPQLFTPFRMWFLDLFPPATKPPKHLSLDPPVVNPAYDVYSKYQGSWNRSARTRFIKKAGFIAYIGANYEAFRSVVSDPDNDYKLDPVVFLGLGNWSDADAKKTLELIDRTTHQVYFCQIPLPLNQETFNNFLGLMILIARGVRMTPILKLDNIPVPTGITIMKGEKLAAADLNGKSDPYCVYGLAQRLGAWNKGNGPYKTKVRKETLNPVWGPNDNASRDLDFLGNPQSHLMIEVFDKDLTGSDRLGYVSIPVSEVTVGERQLQVKPVKNEKATGTITINITSSKFGIGNISF